MKSRRAFRDTVRLKLGMIFAISCLALVSSPAAEKPRKVTIEMEPVGPQEERTVWLAYLLSRANFITKHIDSYPRGAGRVTPSFEEETYARSNAIQIYEELRSKDKKLNLPYFNDLSRVKQAGFMREYVWHYLRQPAWTEKPADIRGEQFETWRRSNLPQHTPITRGGIRLENSAD